MADNFDHLTFTALLGGAVALMKVLEKLIDWVSKKVGGEKAGRVELATEPSRMVRETHEKVTDMEKITARVDRDGIPMVYTPRSSLENQLHMAEALRDVVTKQDSHMATTAELSRQVSEILASIKKPQ